MPMKERERKMGGGIYEIERSPVFRLPGYRVSWMRAVFRSGHDFYVGNQFLLWYNG